jgi:hypothetical protein
VYLDAAKYAARRAKDGCSDSRLIYEVFYAYFLPQFEGMEDPTASRPSATRWPRSGAGWPGRST